MVSFKIITGGLLGWSLGTNDAANVFGTAVSSQMVKWRTAAILIAIFVIIGSLIGGSEGLETYSKLSGQTLNTASAICLAAALTVTLMTLLKIPVSTSQAVVGSIIGTALATSGSFKWQGLTKVVICWVGTPIGAAILAMIFYPILAFAIRRMKLHFFRYDYLMRALLIAAGIYGAYALGANNVANVTGVFYKAGAFGSNPETNKIAALLFGGVTIALGAVNWIHFRHLLQF
ncbi:MAG: inorganic phosphate transporter [Planctomycetota bacterium]|jgi:PiT family inorganic phosphate transporter